MKNSAWATLKNGDAVRCYGWIAVQQAVVAASTYLLIVTAKQAASGAAESAAACATAFALLLVLVYLPTMVSQYYLQRWRLASLETFISRFVEQNSGKTTLRHQEARRQHESVLTNEAPILFEQITSLRYELTSTSLSAMLNVAVIGLAVAPGILVWYGLAGLLLAASSRLSQARIHSVAVDMQGCRTRFSSVVLGAWDNVFVGNSPNLQAWRANFSNRLQNLRHAALRYELTRSAISSATVSTALLLISIGNGWHFYHHRDDIISLTALLITLPRQLQTIQFVFVFFTVLMSYKGVRQQFEGLGKLLELRSRADDSLQYVSLDLIKVYVNGVQEVIRTPDEFLSLLRSRPGIRVTLRAPNGAGKSTLMAYAAERLHPGRVFIPAYSTELEFPGRDFYGLSDGRRAVAMLETLGDQSGSEFILIDEWDANLDPDNVDLIDRKISSWVDAGRIVVETRHRIKGTN